MNVLFRVRRRLALGVMACLSAATIPLGAQAAAWPDQPIRLLVPYSAGGGADHVARVVAMRLGQVLGTNVIVENEPGAGGTIAEGMVVRAKPDGYTVLYDTFTYAVNASLRKLNFNPSTDLAPVAMIARAPLILVVNPKLPVHTLKEYLDLARQKPNNVTYASYGIGSAAHLASALLANEAGVTMLHVPYKGGAPALVDVTGGQVNSYFANASSGLPFIKDGKLRAIAVSSPQRLNTVPDVPTVAESGFPGFDVQDWHGVFVPSATPADVRQKLAAAVQQVVADPKVQAQLRAMGIEPSDTPPSAFPGFIQGQIQRWSTLIKAEHISIQ